MAVDLSDTLARFDPALPLAQASLPPAAWYLDPALLELERRAVLHANWQAVGRGDQVAQPAQFFTGDLAGEPYVVVRDGPGPESDSVRDQPHPMGSRGALRAFSNVCRHHAALVAVGAGCAAELVCPYHGWTYALDGSLKRAPRLGAVRDFHPAEQGLPPLDVQEWGPLVWLRVDGGLGRDLIADLAPLREMLDASGFGPLRFVARRTYEIACNWKVYVDNYLDGGYHVAHLHRGLAAQLDASSYRTELYERFSVQRCNAGGSMAPSVDAGDAGDFAERIGAGALYAWVYPNFMLNRYGPFLDTNWVMPLTHDRTLTTFDYYVTEGEPLDPTFLERSLAASHVVQLEDVAICESVQRGLASCRYDRGRYGVLESSEHQFHKLLHADLTRFLAQRSTVPSPSGTLPP